MAYIQIIEEGQVTGTNKTDHTPWEAACSLGAMLENKNDDVKITVETTDRLGVLHVMMYNTGNIHDGTDGVLCFIVGRS